jgi:hypothetical protein
VSTDYDSPWKEALDAYFEPFLALLFPEVHAQIDWSRGYESLDKEFQQVVREAELGRRYVDKLVKVWTKGGTECWVLVHVEVQTTRDGQACCSNRSRTLTVLAKTPHRFTSTYRTLARSCVANLATHS